MPLPTDPARITDATDDPVEEDTAVYLDGVEPGRPPRRRRLLGGTTGMLVVLLALALAFFAGARTARSRFAATPAEATSEGEGQGQGGGGAGTGTGTTFGQVRLVDGTTIYVAGATGTITKVTTTPGIAITKTSAASLADIRPGDTVAVQGQAQPDGTVAATRVADSGPGGQFPGGGTGGAEAGGGHGPGGG